MSAVTTTSYRKVSKTRARIAHAMGYEVIAIPCKMNPANQFFAMGAVLDKHTLPDFEKACNHLAAYTCTYETGRYLAFYLPE